MSIGVILSIVSGLLKIAGLVIGDYYLAKWITAARVWWRKGAWQSLKEKSDEEFLRIESEWEGFSQDRPDGATTELPNPPKP